MAEELAPPVVAVVVTSDPGPWLESCLAALAAQDYGSLAVLVVDAGSKDPLAARVAAAAPSVYLHRLERNAGFGPSANAVLELVDGSAFYLFCHDDVLPEPDTVRRLVEEAFRSNAGVVAPKLVDQAQPDRLLQLGLAVDRFGAPVRRVTRGELDQSQHDEVRDVFAAPGGCTLVRADLFAALGGFDPAITMFGEDVDLSWRARVAGARVVVAPLARVAHLEATASRRRSLPEARALQWRHELRAVLKNYAGARRVAVVLQLLALSLVEVVWFAARGKRWRARLVLDAWRWNLARRGELATLREAVAGTRRVADREVVRSMEPRTFRVARSAQRLAEGTAQDRSRARRRAQPAHYELIGVARHDDGAAIERGAWLARVRADPRPAVVAACAAAVLVVGARLLLLGHLPIVGELQPFPSPGRLLGDYLGGWTDAGLQRPGPATPAFGLIGLAGLVIGGGTSLLWKVLVLASIALGGIGAARLVSPFTAAWGRASAAVAYLFVPLAVNDLARGDAQALFTFAATPFVLRRLVLSGIGDASGGSHARWERTAIARQSLSLGLLLALAGSFAPVVVPLTVSMALALALGGLAAVGMPALAAARRTVAVALSGCVVAALCTFPWSLTFVQSAGAWSVASGARINPSEAPSLSELLRFDLGPVGSGPIGYGALAAGVIVLAVAREERLDWGARFAGGAVVSFAVAFLASRGLLGPGGGELRAFLAPAAAFLAAAIGLGVEALGRDLGRSGIGWRQAVAVLAGLAGLVSLSQVTAASAGGRFGLPVDGYDTVLSWLQGTPSASGPVLWLGDPPALPLAGWQLTPGLAAGLTPSLPDGTADYPSASAGPASPIGGDVATAAHGLTVTLGASLAAEGIRYVVVPAATAPVLAGVQSAIAAPPPQGLVAVLAVQQDLKRLPSEGGAAVFEVTAWRGAAAAASGAGGTPAPLRELGLALSLACTAACGTVLARRRPPRSAARRAHAHRAGDHRGRSREAAGAAPPAGADADAQVDELVVAARRR